MTYNSPAGPSGTQQQEDSRTFDPTAPRGCDWCTCGMPVPAPVDPDCPVHGSDHDEPA